MGSVRQKRVFSSFGFFSPGCVTVYSVSWRILHIVKIYRRTAYIVNWLQTVYSQTMEHVKIVMGKFLWKTHTDE